MRVGVIGAGIGGLAVAIGLQNDGHDVTIFERQDSATAPGAGLSLFGNAFAAFNALGLGEVVLALTSNHAPLFRAGQRTPSGRWLMAMPQRSVASLRVLHRVDLHAAFLNELMPGSLCTGTKADVAQDGSPTITVNGSAREFDLVVAADGVRSQSRSTLGLDTGLRYAGYTAWRGTTAVPIDLRGEAGETWGRGKRFGIAPLPDGRVYWFATQSLAAGTENSNERDAVLKNFNGWHDPICSLVEATEKAAVLRHDIYDLERPLRTYARGATLLLGDAAHAMTPDLGQGAGQALEDAATVVVLARVGGDRANARIIAHDYDLARRKRSQLVAARSRSMASVAQLSVPAAVVLRDLALALLPARLAANAALRLQRWP